MASSLPNTQKWQIQISGSPFSPLEQNLHCSILSYSSFNYFNVIDPDKKPFIRTWSMSWSSSRKIARKSGVEFHSRPNFHNPASPYILTLWVCSFFYSHKLFPNKTVVAASVYLLASSVSQWLSWMAWAFVLIGGGHNSFSSKAKKVRNFQVNVQKLRTTLIICFNEAIKIVE